MVYIKLGNSLYCYFLRIFVLAFCIFIFGCSNHSITLGPGISPAYSDNVIVAFFDEAERQIETDDQRQVLAQALNDMLTLSPDELRKQRYANYQLEPGKWTLHEILARYYAARPPIEFDELLYEETASSRAKNAIKKALFSLQKSE
ncbi:MAG: hypothetical protein L3J89_09140 [Gammaproteobacteria bacterium]|nr:hypothetical protein [Gammaproteobacteria bacterium]MCF6324473.1 hypothetical protein [Gammaproteobacteria bacterium]